MPSFMETGGVVGPSWIDKLNSSIGGVSSALSNIKISPTVNASVKIPTYIYLIALALIGFGVWGMFKKRR